MTPARPQSRDPQGSLRTTHARLGRSDSANGSEDGVNADTLRRPGVRAETAYQRDGRRPEPAIMLAPQP